MAMQFNQTSGRGGNRGGRGANRGFSRGGRGQGRGSGTGFSRGGRGASRGFSRGGRGGKRALSDDLNVGHSELGEAVHRCEELLICRLTNQRVPYFNAPVFLDNKAPIGKIEDVFGTYNDTVWLNFKHFIFA